MQPAQHHRAFAVSVAWTLGLLWLGSVVHATESSLACPDWPTCFGTMVPAMEGGVFWEHLHRLVAGGLILMFGLATWLAWRQEERRWVVRASVAGVFLLLVQAVFGGLTVILRLPDAVSTTHLGLALGFLGLATVLAAATSPRRHSRPSLPPGLRRTLRRGGSWVAGLVFAQSVLGGAVRHADAGMACGTGLLCNGGLLPPQWTHLVGLQWLHRALGIAVAVAVLAFAARLLRPGAPGRVRGLAWTVALLVLVQVALGFLSAWTVLAVTPVSLHTLAASGLLAASVLLAAWGYLGPGPDAALRDEADRDGRASAPGPERAGGVSPMDAEALGNLLAPVNAGLNLTATVLLTLGFVFIKRGRRDRHMKAMLGAVAASGLFLVFYVTRFALTGTHEFAGEGPARAVYLSILFSHMILAVVVVPLVLRLLYLAYRERFAEHRRLARWTWPIWMYVSVTGFVVYLLLYHVYGYR